MSITLLGYMGSGKSTIGKLLANQMVYSFLDLDTYIETKEKATIREIFDKKGEVYFRNIETQALEEVLKHSKNTIISLGGGTPCYGANLGIIKKYSKSIYLKVSISILCERLENEKDQRPLLKTIHTNEKLHEYIAKHLFERNYFYMQAQHILQINKELTAEETVKKIIKLL